MGGRVGGAGERVGEQGAGKHHHVGSLGQGRLDRYDRNTFSFLWSCEVDLAPFDKMKLLNQDLYLMGGYHDILKITLPLLDFNHNIYKPCSSDGEEQLLQTFLLFDILLLIISQGELDLLLSGLEIRRAECLASVRLLTDCFPRT